MPSTSEQIRARVQEVLGARYRVLGQLDVGPTALLLRAVDAATGREVALKVFTTDALTRPEIRDRVVRAIELGAQLTHPHIIAPLRLEQHETIIGYPMDLARGGALETRLRVRDPLPTERVLDMVRETAAALDYIHARGLVHGGVKPSNILFDDAGHALLADAGIERAIFTARSIYPANAQQAQAYHAPELRYQRAIDGRADQYALAVIAYELMTGQRRLDAAVVQGIQTVAPLEIPADVPLRPGVGLHVNAALRKALSTSAAARFATAGAFAEALGGASGATQPGPGSGRAKSRLRPAGYLVPLGLAVVAVACALALSGAQGKERAARAWQALRGPFTVLVAQVRIGTPAGGILPEAPMRQAQDALRNHGPADRPASSLTPGGGLLPASRQPAGPGEPGGRGGRSGGDAGGAGTTGGTTGGTTVLLQLRGLPRAVNAPAAQSAPSAPHVPTLGSLSAPAASTPTTGGVQSLLSRLGALLGFGGSKATPGASGPAAQGTTVLGTSGTATVASEPASPASDGLQGDGAPGYIQVLVDQGTAVVLIDGIPRGSTPFVTRLPAGSHSVSAHSLDGSYLPASAVVTIDQADTTTAVFRKTAPGGAP